MNPAAAPASKPKSTGSLNKDSPLELTSPPLPPGRFRVRGRLRVWPSRLPASRSQQHTPGLKSVCENWLGSLSGTRISHRSRPSVETLG